MRANRAVTLFEEPRRWNVRRYAIAAAVTFGAVLTLSAGLIVGASTGFASVEVLDAKKREADLATMATARQLASLRLELAQANYTTVQRDVAAGTASRADLRVAKEEVDSMQAYVARVDVDIAARRTTIPPPRSKLAILTDLPGRRALAALACAAVNAAPASTQQKAAAQQGIPVVETSPILAASKTTVGTFFGVRELSDGRVLVNDPTRKQVVLFDRSLSSATPVIDSVPGTAKSYPQNIGKLSRYLGDSSIFGGGGQPHVVLDGNGQIIRALAPPQMDLDFGQSIGFPPPDFIDPRGRLYARGVTYMRGRTGMPRVDTTEIVRADLETRQVDRVGYLTSNGGRNRQDPPINGRRVVTSILQPVPTEDSWTVLSDGTIAFVRGKDYHVDWILPDGTQKSTDRLPFDWRPLTDADKQHMIDSARVVWDSLMLIRNKRVGSMDANGNIIPFSGVTGDEVGRGGRSGGAGPPPNGDAAVQRMDFVPLSEIPDFYPAVHRDAAMADLDGNLWLLPTTSAQSQHGELVYDVLTPNRGLFARVRMPVGRSIVGFGKGGVLYLQSGDRKTGFHLERVKVEVK
jgi:hypothetical protein